VGTRILPPVVSVRSGELEEDAGRLARLVTEFGHHLQHLLAVHQKGIVDRQYQLARVSDAATELYVSACVLNRLERRLGEHNGEAASRSYDLQTGRYYLRTADRRIRQNLADLWNNDDEATTALANRVLR
jgi:very long chain acyl-CoA dehydrogenase